jgi:hypothetical protein
MKMKIQGLTILVAVALSAGFVGCDSGTPGNQAGYVGDGTNYCSDQIETDAEQIQNDMGAITGYANTLSDPDSTSAQQAGAIAALNSSIPSVTDEINNFKATYNGVVCNADLTEGDTSTITSTSFDSDLAELQGIQAQIDQMENQGNGHHHGNPPISGQPVLECNPQMVQAQLQIQNDAMSLQATYNALPADRDQRMNALVSLMNSIERTQAEISDYNSRYTGMSCSTGTGADSISTISAQTSLLQAKVQVEENKLQPTRDHIEK